MRYTAFCLPTKEIGNVSYYGDIEAFDLVRVLVGQLSLTAAASLIRLKCIRFSIFHPEQYTDPNVGLLPKNIENLPYMVHFKWRNVDGVRNELQKQVLKIPNAQTIKVDNDQPDFPDNFNVIHDGTYVYSTHATLKSSFQYFQRFHAHLDQSLHQVNDQGQFFYELDRDVVVMESDLLDGQMLEFEIVLTNGRGKRVIDRYAPPVEVEFEVE